MSKESEATPAATAPAKKPINHKLEKQVIPSKGGSYVVKNKKLIKQKEG